jgi:hypothetical protein
MRRTIAQGLLVVSAIAFLSGPTFACINDRESPLLERKFKSSYLDSVEPDSSASPGSSPALQNVSLASGAVLLVAGAAFGLLPSRRIGLNPPPSAGGNDSGART